MCWRQLEAAEQEAKMALDIDQVIMSSVRVQNFLWIYGEHAAYHVRFVYSAEVGTSERDVRATLLLAVSLDQVWLLADNLETKTTWDPQPTQRSPESWLSSLRPTPRATR